MLIIPAIDIKDGCVVRLVQGRTDKKVYSSDPLKTAKHWARQGANILHVVDLDGAASGSPKNLKIVEGIIRAANIPVEAGGGVRNMETIKRLLDCGAWRVVLGTRATEDKKFLKKAIKKFKKNIIVSIDAKDDKVLIKGWQANARVRSALAFACALKEMGFKELIYTNVAKDGTLNGPDIQGIKRLLKETGLGIIASGGISSLDDLSRLRLLQRQGLRGVIIGKALYEGHFTLFEALKFS